MCGGGEAISRQETRLHRRVGQVPRPNVELHDVDIVGTFVLADLHNLSAYDASYLWLARDLDVELVTLDQQLLALLHAP